MSHEPLFTFFLGRDRAVFQQNAGLLGFGKVEDIDSAKLTNDPCNEPTATRKTETVHSLVLG